MGSRFSDDSALVRRRVSGHLLTMTTEKLSRTVRYFMTLGKFFEGFRLDHDQHIISLPSLHHYIVFGNCHAFCEDIMDFCMKRKSVGH